MDLFSLAVDFFLHLDRHLPELIRQYGVWSYALLFVVIFCETGLIVTPLLPGDSLLFAAGTLAAAGALDVNTLCVTLCIAAILGDTVNYWIGAWLGPKVFYEENARFFKKEYLDRTHRFYERYGGKTIILARFIPIIRTFAPFVAGIGRMSYARFLIYNATGGIVWVVSLTYCGYLFGNLPLVKDHYSTVILAIIIISILPMVYEFIRQKRGYAS